MRTQVIFLISSFILFSHISYSVPGSLCEEDNRILSKRKRVGRLIRPNVDETGCTAFLIGKSCMLSAGHCRKKLGVVEFNVPLSTAEGEVRYSKAKDQYRVERKSMRYDHGSGLDYMVFRTLPNRITKKYAGEVEGFYDLKLGQPKVGDVIEIVGYGYNHSRRPEEYNVQKYSINKIKGFHQGKIYYNADTSNGNSGSPIILAGTNRVIGIHTNGGGCYRQSRQNSPRGNHGQLFAGREDLRTMISECLAWEAQNIEETISLFKLSL